MHETGGTDTHSMEFIVVRRLHYRIEYNATEIQVSYHTPTYLVIGLSEYTVTNPPGLRPGCCRISYSPANASILGSSIVNVVGTAVAKVKRDDGGCWGYGGWGPNPSKSPSYSPSPSPSPTKSQSQTSGTATTSSSTSFPTTLEAGTCCGFINPEDPCAPQPDGWPSTTFQTKSSANSV